MCLSVRDQLPGQMERVASAVFITSYDEAWGLDMRGKLYIWRHWLQVWTRTARNPSSAMPGKRIGPDTLRIKSPTCIDRASSWMILALRLPPIEAFQWINQKNYCIYMHISKKEKYINHIYKSKQILSCCFFFWLTWHSTDFLVLPILSNI